MNAPTHDYPSLRDLETSNLFSGVNHNFNIQRHLDEHRLAKLEALSKKFELLTSAEKGLDYVTFEEIIKTVQPKLKNSQRSAKEVPITKASAVESFMDMLVFTQAGYCKMKQSHLRDRFSSSKFSSIQIYKVSS